MPTRHVFFDINGTLFDPSRLGEPVDEVDGAFPHDVVSDAAMLAMAVSLGRRRRGDRGTELGRTELRSAQQ